MTTAYSNLLGLALPVTGELSGTWGDTVNDYITKYLDDAIANAQIISGSQTAVTLSKTTGSSLVSAGSGATGSAQYALIRCTGNPASTLTITVDYSSLTNAQFSKTYLIFNSTSTSQSVVVRATTSSGTSTGVTITSGEKALIAWNGTDFVKIATQSGTGRFVTIEVTNIKANDGTASIVLTDSTGAVDMSKAVTMSATTQNIDLGTSQTSGTFTVGGAAQTGTQTFDQSTKTHTLNIGTGATENAATKTVNLATAGVSGSTTTMSVGSAVSGAITNLTVNATTTLAPIARSTGAVSYFTVTTPADTGLTASTEVIGSSFSAATRTWATGALTLQRERVFAAPTYAFAGASTLTTAVNVDIGLPVAGTNATITNAYALRADNTLFTGNVVLNNASAALDLTNLEVTNIKAKDGTASMTLADSTGIITLSATAGTANGVAYLNGSRAVTSDSKLTFDGTTFSVANGVAGGTSLSLTGSYTGSGNVNLISFQRVGGAVAGALRYSDDNPFGMMFGTTTSHAQIFMTANTERMRISSAGDVGIGTSSPTGYLANKLVIATGTDSNNGITIASATNRNGAIWFADGTTGSEAYRGGVDYQHTTDTLYLYSGGQGNFQLTAAGNLGLGVTPSAWFSTSRVYQFGSGGALEGRTNESQYLALTANQYIDSAGARKYIGSTFASLYQQYNGKHEWFTAPSGFGYGTAATSLTATQNGNSYTIVTAGTTDFTLIGAADNNVGTTFTKSGGTGAGTGTVSQNISFTQAMTLDASGNLAFRQASSTTTTIAFQNLAGTQIQRIRYDDSDGSLTVGGGTATAYPLKFFSGNSQAMTLDASGNLVIGDTSAGSKFDVLGGNSSGSDWGNINITSRNVINATNRIYTALRIRDSGSSDAGAIGYSYNGTGYNMMFATVPSVGGAITERARITSGGEFQIGPFGGNGTGTISASPAGTGFTNQPGSDLVLQSGNATGAGSSIIKFLTPSPGSSGTSTNTATERARITSGGYFKASNDGSYEGSTGSYHELRSTTDDEYILRMQSTGATLPYGILVKYTAASPNSTASNFFVGTDSTTVRCSLRSNGGLANYQSNNVDLSDARTKKEITPAPSYWDKIGALEIVTYKYNDQTHDDVNVGVIAQQVESVEPVWVDADGFGEIPEDGVPLKTVYTKDITFAAIKALQEAMARIEKLEAEVAALKGA